MDLITMEKLKKISAKRSEWSVSLYMPAHRTGQEVEQDPIRFKNLLQEVEKRLLEKELRLPKVQDMLKKPRRLLQDSNFWQHQSDGLALFFSEDLFYSFRLPLNFTETIVITDRFHLKPLFPILTSDGTFHILAISQNQLRLMEGTRHTVDEVNLGDTPETLAEVFPDGFSKKELQFHTGTPSKGHRGRAAIFHGQDSSNDLKTQIKQWFRIIDKAVVNILSNTQSPLVLAGVDSLFPLYKEINSYPYLVDEGIPGNPDEMKPEDLHPMAWAIAEPIFNEKRKASLAQYQQLVGTGQTTADISEAVLAAHHGQIATLFVATGVQVWGKFDQGSNEVHLRETPQHGDEDLLDFMAIQTLTKGGEVFVVSPKDVPGQALVAAILRH